MNCRLKPPPAFRARAMGRYLFQRPVSDARALRSGVGFPCEIEGREGEGRGRPTREIRLMVRLYRPRPENSRPEGSLLGVSEIERRTNYGSNS